MHWVQVYVWSIYSVAIIVLVRIMICRGNPSCWWHNVRQQQTWNISVNQGLWLEGCPRHLSAHRRTWNQWRRTSPWLTEAWMMKQLQWISDVTESPWPRLARTTLNWELSYRRTVTLPRFADLLFGRSRSSLKWWDLLETVTVTAR